MSELSGDKAPVRLYHTMKIWERIMDKRVRGEVEVAEEQFGFMPGQGTTRKRLAYVVHRSGEGV